MTEQDIRNFMSQFPVGSVAYNFLQTMLNKTVGPQSLTPEEYAQHTPYWDSIQNVLALQNFIDNHSWDPSFNTKYYQQRLDAARNALSPQASALVDQINNPWGAARDFLIANGIDPSSISHTYANIQEAQALAANAAKTPQSSTQQTTNAASQPSQGNNNTNTQPVANPNNVTSGSSDASQQSSIAATKTRYYQQQADQTTNQRFATAATKVAGVTNNQQTAPSQSATAPDTTGPIDNKAKYYIGGAPITTASGIYGPQMNLLASKPSGVVSPSFFAPTGVYGLGANTVNLPYTSAVIQILNKKNQNPTSTI